MKNIERINSEKTFLWKSVTPINQPNIKVFFIQSTTSNDDSSTAAESSQGTKRHYSGEPKHPRAAMLETSDDGSDYPAKLIDSKGDNNANLVDEVIDMKNLSGENVIDKQHNNNNKNKTDSPYWGVLSDL